MSECASERDNAIWAWRLIEHCLYHPCCLVNFLGCFPHFVGACMKKVTAWADSSIALYLSLMRSPILFFWWAEWNELFHRFGSTCYKMLQCFFFQFRVLSLLVQYVLAKLIYLIHTLPLYVSALWLIRSPRVAGN